MRERSGSGQHDRDAIATEEFRLRNLESRHDALTAEISSAAPELHELVSSEPVSLERLQELAARDRVDVVQYLALESIVVIWRTGPSGSHAQWVLLPRAQLAAKVEALRENIGRREYEHEAAFDDAAARQLFLYLIQPILDEVETDHLVIIAHDALNQLPFQALLNPSDGKFLGERFAISYAPSATVLAGLGEPGPIAGGRLLAAADPTISTAPREIRTIAALYPGRSAVLDAALPTAAMVRSRVSDAEIIHLSVHGTFVAEEPLLSYLDLRPDDGDDGKLTAAEMFGLPLDRAGLVVLSACESGQATVTRSNETLGIVRALLYAGADALVLSQWRVEAGSTAAWMEAFYRAAQTEPLAEAARRAVAAVRQNPEYRHPFHWAAFRLVGR